MQPDRGRAGECGAGVSRRKAIGSRTLDGYIDIGSDVARSDAAHRILQKQFAEQKYRCGGDQHDRRRASGLPEKQHDDSDNQPYNAPLTQQRELGHQKIKERASEVCLDPVEYLKVYIGNLFDQGDLILLRDDSVVLYIIT